jgi:hypothetical protein
VVLGRCTDEQGQVDGSAMHEYLGAERVPLEPGHHFWEVVVWALLALVLDEGETLVGHLFEPESIQFGRLGLVAAPILDLTGAPQVD